MTDDAPKLRGPRLTTIPLGDNRLRLVCPDCHYIAYANPKIVVGSVPVWEDRVLLCRRAIEPRRGWWTLPAGFMELGETPAEGAAREAWEEAQVRIVIDGLLGVYSLTQVDQVMLIFRSRLTEPAFAAGPESLEVRLCAWEDIPWGALAFPSVTWALRLWHAGRNEPLGAAVLTAGGGAP